MAFIKLIEHSSRRGVATHPYPEKPFEVDELYRGKPVLDASACIGCGACANACPAETIKVETDYGKGVRRWTIYYGRCIFCARCQEVCPVNAIELSREFELAAKNREDLTVVAEFKLGSCAKCKGYLDVSIRHVELAQKLLERSEIANIMQELARYMVMCLKCKRSFFVEKLGEATRG
ncbi:MAG TPA: 4Fe-4S dicluster domain-containing protein [Pyrodictium sp.]|nr:4Fe-4S dicluster domain-containing protein [Pyrodictium sp.]